MLTYSNKYSINTGNFFYEPSKRQNNLHRNYYCYSSNSNENKNNTYNNKNINYYSYLKRDKNYFNTRTTNSCYNNIYTNELNDINNTNFNFSKKNINFNCDSNKKIKLTYEFENISPNEISDKMKELIDLQSQMCTLDDDLDKNIKKNKNKKNLSRSQKSINSNLLSVLTSYKTNYKSKSIKRNNTVNELMNSDNKFRISSDNNKSRIKRSNSMNKNMIKIWKDKCDELDKDISNVKNNIKKVKSINAVLNKRINDVKEKEDKKYDIYDKNYKVKIYNKKLVEKLKLSEEIKKKQIELIIKMQKEVNNMRLKLHMLGECCM